MEDQWTSGSDTPALTELRTRLSEALARNRMNKTDLSNSSHLGRTTVSEAFQADGPLPSERTLTALARVLKLPAEELLALRREAADGVQRLALGRLIVEWDPHDLEVHPAGPGATLPGHRASEADALPGYVERAHDLMLGDAVRDARAGRSRMLVLVGESSTGKTRACWEAVQALADDGWRLWHPFDPTRAEAALDDLRRVAPQTVVWLNEAQHYFGDRKVGERITAALHALLTTSERGPVLVLGTLWPGYANRYTALPKSGKKDRYSRVRELLAGRTVCVPETFDAQALAMAAAKAHGGDQLLADALARSGVDGRVAQDLAGAPELLKRYKQATPAARAVLEAAMDARRLGVGLHLPQAFLTAASADYLKDSEYDQLARVKRGGRGWTERAYAELAKEVHGKQAPLRSTTPRLQHRSPTLPDNPTASASGPMLRLADYLEQHGRTACMALCPPASFWHAALTHLTRPDDLHALAEQAERRHRLQWSHHLRHRAVQYGSTAALSRLALLREEAGDWAGAQDLARRAVELGSTKALRRLAMSRMFSILEGRESAEDLMRWAVDHGDDRAIDLGQLAWIHRWHGDRDGAENLYRRAADLGNIEALRRLAELQEEAGNRESAEDFFRRAADLGDTYALLHLALWRESAGDRAGAEDLARRAADLGSTYTLCRLAELRDREGAEDLYRRAADLGDTSALCNLALWRTEAGDREGAEDLYGRAADLGDTSALSSLA
ncbi:sel1 repeat family protein, partial [Streptomyces sp. TLI_185]|uniref:sel1 repeat family protein n=1 Tax=Streptomyces sp. TLI_185 TaxID=2485151 RepID=UPI000F516A63